VTCGVVTLDVPVPVWAGPPVVVPPVVPPVVLKPVVVEPVVEAVVVPTVGGVGVVAVETGVAGVEVEPASWASKG
jgi:hypothetical protein